jgi:hypothetical protein
MLSQTSCALRDGGPILFFGIAAPESSRSRIASIAHDQSLEVQLPHPLDWLGRQEHSSPAADRNVLAQIRDDHDNVRLRFGFLQCLRGVTSAGIEFEILLSLALM